MKEYNKYTKPIMDELSKKFKFFTQVDGHTWKVQSKKDSMMEAFTVTTTDNCHIIMSGDYDGVMVRPYGNADCLPNWMAGATTISYFAEKVLMANRYHKCKEYSLEEAKKNIEEIKQSYLEEFKDEHEDDFMEKVKKVDDVIGYNSLEMEHEYRTLIGELEHELQLCDLCEYSPDEYTHQFKWQHKCLIFWANKVLEGAFIEQNKPEVNSPSLSKKNTKEARLSSHN